jgi:hypothetical protein
MTWLATCSAPGMKTAGTLPRTPQNLTMTTSLPSKLYIPPTDPGWAHISLLFREMWDAANLNRSVSTTNPDPKCQQAPKSGQDNAVESHISRKTSEIWGTQDW